jgi:heme exporter protein A
MLRLSATGLGCVRGFRSVFNDLNLQLDSGEALALTGPNGAGKSSLLRLLAGLLRPSAGRVTLDGGGSDDRSMSERTHYLGHLDAFKPALSVRENIEFWVHYLGSDRDAALALAAVGLESLRALPAAYLSAGQRRRLSLARLVAVPRPLWLLDEPASALDSAGQEMLAGLMRAHLAGGGMIVAATHGPLGVAAKELQLGRSAPSPLEGEGWGGGSGGERTVTTPTPSPSPQGGGEQSGARGHNS